MTQRDLEPGQERERMPEEIRAEITRTRAAVQHDIKAIGEKLSPEYIKQGAENAVSDVFEARGPARERNSEQEGASMAREAKDAAVEAVDSLRAARERAVETASETAHELKQRAREAGEATADYARRAGRYARRAGGAGADFVADNALPLSLIGIGVGWLVLSARRQHEARLLEEADLFFDDEEELALGTEYDDEHELSRRAPRRALAGRARGRLSAWSDETREQAHHARVRAGELADSVRTRAGEWAENARTQAGELAERATRGVESARTRVSEAASELSHQAADMSHEARERLQRAQLRGRDFAEENPLVVGAMAVAAGVGIGLLLPATRPENRLLGDARDRLLGDARGLLDEARASGGRLRETARETAQELRSAAREPRASH